MRRLLLACLAATSVGCGDGAASRPSLPPLSLILPAAVEGRYTNCATCAEPVTVVVGLAVTVVDANGPGGTVATLETRVVNNSRGVEVARNVRPNAVAGLSPSALPAGGRVTIETGLVFPPPPPRDALSLVVVATLTDGREATETTPLAIVN